MEIFAGKSVFGGIAIGRISIYSKNEQQVKRIKVTDVEYMGDYALLCQFNDGKKKYVNLEPLLKFPMM